MHTYIHTMNAHTDRQKRKKNKSFRNTYICEHIYLLCTKKNAGVNIEKRLLKIWIFSPSICSAYMRIYAC